MGILNVTPDSFSDGGQFLDPDAAVRRGLELIEEGADIIDVGGESTRPGAEPVPESEERRRVLPVIERLRAQTQIPISIDTMKPGVARAALQAGASLVNDVGANRAEPTMAQVVAETGAGYVLMHMQGQPANMQQAPHYGEVVAEVGQFFEERLRGLQAAGVQAEQVVLDVGIGFGKSLTHNLQLLAALESFTKWGRPLLLGASRKSFIQQAVGASGTTDRLPGSLACVCLGLAQGVNILRVHDMAATRQAARLTESILEHRSGKG
jgi:dihydropteroate synthase